MEIEGEDGSKLSLEPGAKTVFGRGKGFEAEDRTVSRRQALLELDTAEPRVSFEILGKNPIWVRSQITGKIEIFRRFEKGEFTNGDRFCVSGQRPVWFTLKKRDIGNGVVEEEISEVDNGLDGVDISNIDPVKEFGFLVIGKEFEQYPKNRVRDIKQWDWFLEESRKQNRDDDDDDGQITIKGKKSSAKKRCRSKGNDDEDWTGESGDDRELITKTRKSQRPKYSTRSKDPEKPRKGIRKDRERRDGVDDEEEDDDETLGGFIVDDDDEAELEEGDESGEEEEEDFEDDEDEN